MKNEKIKREMAGMTQKDLAEILEVQPPYVSIILNKFELDEKEQDEIIRKIKERR